MKGPRVWPIFVGYVVALTTMGFAGAIVLRLWFGRHGLPPMAGKLDLPLLLVSVLASQLTLLVLLVLFTRPLTAQRLRLGPSAASPPTLAAITLGTIALGQTLESASTLLGFHD